MKNKILIIITIILTLIHSVLLGYISFFIASDTSNITTKDLIIAILIAFVTGLLTYSFLTFIRLISKSNKYLIQYSLSFIIGYILTKPIYSNLYPYIYQNGLNEIGNELFTAIYSWNFSPFLELYLWFIYIYILTNFILLNKGKIIFRLINLLPTFIASIFFLFMILFGEILTNQKHQENFAEMQNNVKLTKIEIDYSESVSEELLRDIPQKELVGVEYSIYINNTSHMEYYLYVENISKGFSSCSNLNPNYDIQYGNNLYTITCAYSKTLQPLTEKDLKITIYNSLRDTYLLY